MLLPIVVGCFIISPFSDYCPLAACISGRAGQRPTICDLANNCFGGYVLSLSKTNLMIQQMTDLPANMAGFRSSGKVTKEDFDFVIDRVREKVESSGELNYMLVLDNDPSDFTAGAWLNDAWLGVKNLLKWNRAAIVTDLESVIAFTDAFSKVMPGEFRGYRKSELQKAIDWVSGVTN